MSGPDGPHLMANVEEFILEALDGVPPAMDGENAGRVMFLGGLAIAARGLGLMLPAPTAKALRGRVRDFLDAREPRVEADLIDLAEHLAGHLR